MKEKLGELPEAFWLFFFIISTLCNCLLLLVSTKKRRGVFGYAGPFSFFFFWYFFVVVVEILVDPLRSSAIFRGCGHRTNMAGGTRQPSQQLANLRGQKKNKQTKEQNNNQRNVAKNAGEADQKRKKKRKSETETSEPRHAKKKKKTKQKKTNKKSGPFFGWIRSVRLAQQHPPHPMRRHQVPSDFENIAFYFFQTREQPGNPRRSSSRIKNLETQATTTTTTNNNSNNNNISVKRANPRTRRN